MSSRSDPPWAAPLAPPQPLPPAEPAGREEPLADDAARVEAEAVEHAAHPLPPAALQGDLSARPFPELLGDLSRARKSGALLLRRGPIKKIVYFREGRPVSVKSNLLSECLGRVLVRERMITEAECEESLRRMGQTGRRQGTVLVEMGCLGPHNLVFALRLQLEVKLYEVFAWRGGEHRFSPAAEVPAEPVAFERSPAALINQGLRRTWDAERVHTALGPIEGCFVHPAADPLLRFQDAGLQGEERALLDAIDGRKSIATLVALDLLPEPESLRLVYALRCAHVVELRPAPAAAPFAAFRLERPAVPAFNAPPPLRAASQVPPAERGARPDQAPPPLTKTVPVPPSAPRSLLPELSGLFPAAPSRQERAARERLARVAATLRRQDFFERLGLDRAASAERVEQAWLERARDFHPDAHAGSSSAEVRELAAQVLALLAEAHAALAGDSERARYLVELASGCPRPASDGVGRILAAEARFQRGEELLRAGRFQVALDAFREAVELFPDEGEFRAYLGWTLFQARPGDAPAAEEAVRQLEHAIRLNPRLDSGYLFLGYVYQATRRPDRAEEQFEKALQCNPDCLEALHELRLLGRGSVAAPK